MERLPNGLYSPEFRAEAVKLVEQTGMSIDRAATQLSIPKSRLSNWVRAKKKGKRPANPPCFSGWGIWQPAMRQ